MFEIIFPRHGAILNHNYGNETADGLEIQVQGVGGFGGIIRVNGRMAEYDGVGFSAPVVLKSHVNTITVELEDSQGKTVRQIQVVWDKASFKRFDFFIDDHSFVFTEIARTKPAHLFDHFYLKFLKEMHDKYGAKFTLNTFYQNDHDPDKFNLSQFPDCYRSEWEEQSDWLKLAFHAYSEFPDRTYQNTDSVQVGRDYDLVTRELVRIAGEKSVITPVALHWAMCRPEALDELAKRGVTSLEGQFINPITGVTDQGSADFVCDVGYFLNLEDARYLEKQRVLQNFKRNIIFYKGDCTANLLTCEQITERLEQTVRNCKRETISLASHEQYSFPGYFNYIPDHFKRIETAIRFVIEKGFKPVFFADGLLGNTAWK